MGIDIFGMHVYVYEDEVRVSLSREDNLALPGSFTVKNWGSGPDWFKVQQLIKFFEPQWVYVSPRMKGGQELTQGS